MTSYKQIKTASAAATFTMWRRTAVVCPVMAVKATVSAYVLAHRNYRAGHGEGVKSLG